MECKVYPAASGDYWRMRLGASGAGGDMAQIGGRFSPKSELDLAMMVSEFLEFGSAGADSRCSSDSDSGFHDLPNLAHKICRLKCASDQYERDMLSVVSSLLLSVGETDLQHVKLGLCNASCVRFSLVKLLRQSGYDAGVCATKWPGSSKVPGGDHEYVDVIYHSDAGSPERLIIDIDFHSHFEIARAVESYDRILSSLPGVYVGSWNRLNQLLQVMVEAARASLKQNSMPFPPWRSLAYLQAKWETPYKRKLIPDEQSVSRTNNTEHKQCDGYLRRLQSEIEIERILKPVNNSWRPNHGKLKQFMYKTL